jgi:hypothetical protein
MEQRPGLFWQLTFVAACAALLAAGTVLFLQTSSKHDTALSKPPTDEPVRAACGLPNPSLRPFPEADHAPGLFSAEKGVTLLLDGKALTPEEGTPVPLVPGEHVLEARALGMAPLEWRFVPEPYRPVLGVVRMDAELGLSAIRLGARCATCIAPLAPVALAGGGSRNPSSTLQRDAAKALRGTDWQSAARNLKEVPNARRTVLFHRLASATYAAADMPESALRESEEAAKDDAGLQRALADWKKLRVDEALRRSRVRMDRWNASTERFSQMLQKFEGASPGAAQQASRRMEPLGVAFRLATKEQDVEAADAVVRSAEEVLARWVEQLQTAHPKDCEFQARVLAEAQR